MCYRTRHLQTGQLGTTIERISVQGGHSCEVSELIKRSDIRIVVEDTACLRIGRIERTILHRFRFLLGHISAVCTQTVVIHHFKHSRVGLVRHNHIWIEYGQFLADGKALTRIGTCNGQVDVAAHVCFHIHNLGQCHATVQWVFFVPFL